MPPVSRIINPPSEPGLDPTQQPASSGDGEPTQRVVLTGAAGFIGRCVCRALVEAGLDVTAVDRVPIRTGTDEPAPRRAILADITTEPDRLEEAFADHDVLIHLAGWPYNDGDFLTDIVGPNVIGLYRVIESAARAGIGRLVLASSMQVDHMLECRGPTATEPDRPLNWYGLTKRYLEAVGLEAARCRGVEVVLARIGWFVRNEREARHIRSKDLMGNYLSPGDAGRFFIAASVAPFPDVRPRCVTASVTSRSPSGPRQPAEPFIYPHQMGFTPVDAWPRGVEDLLPSVDRRDEPRSTD